MTDVTKLKYHKIALFMNLQLELIVFRHQG